MSKSLAVRTPEIIVRMLRYPFFNKVLDIILVNDISVLQRYREDDPVIMDEVRLVARSGDYFLHIIACHFIHGVVNKYSPVKPRRSRNLTTWQLFLLRLYRQLANKACTSIHSQMTLCSAGELDRKLELILIKLHRRKFLTLVKNKRVRAGDMYLSTKKLVPEEYVLVAHYD
jgi:hypothetical protein